MAPRFCCCSTCIIASDSFNRTASTLGSGWTEVATEWATVASPPWVEGYAESQIDGAIAINNTSHPVPDESGVVFLHIINETEDSGDSYKAIVNAVDIDNYHFAEYIRNGASDSILRLGICVSGADTILESRLIVGLTDPVGEARVLSVMIADNEFCASVTHAVLSKVYTDEAVIPLGYKAGMGGSLGTQFSYWEYDQHAETLDGCPHCLCNCEEKYIVPILNAHLEGTGRMAGLSCDIALLWVEVDSNWQGTATCCDQVWDLTLTCPEESGTPQWDVNTAKMTVNIGCKDSDLTNTGAYYIGPGVRYANELSTCSPISLVFGIFNVTTAELSCACGTFGTAGTYTITVTE
jgi:hypothetical protein